MASFGLSTTRRRPASLLFSATSRTGRSNRRIRRLDSKDAKRAAGGTAPAGLDQLGDPKPFAPRRIELAGLDAAARARLLLRAEDDLAEFLAPAQAIIDRVRAEGDAALAACAREFDGAELAPAQLRATAADFDRAERELEPALKETLEYAAANIRAHHAAQLPAALERSHSPRPGVTVTEVLAPVASAACYCPRGKGSFPSVALMGLIPAALAKVPTLVLLTPPAPDGSLDAATLYAARLAGVETVVKAGGAQAVAAAAYGTASVPRCVRIEGPGSPWVAAAKRLLAGRIASRLPAGPSEAIILADSTSTPRLCALDMLIEAEHGPDSS
ncbi:MAG: histidinol dehydrogenase, partial [Betaproteobacteria bacterium AqS2]|nr:histidinol dehydrogenase [Betaproteobacteria bacterium AqS2]